MDKKSKKFLLVVGAGFVGWHWFNKSLDKSLKRKFGGWGETKYAFDEIAAGYQIKVTTTGRWRVYKMREDGSHHYLESAEGKAGTPEEAYAHALQWVEDNPRS